MTDQQAWREILPPVDVDSLGKLNEWLSQCGMPQRDRYVRPETLPRPDKTHQRIDPMTGCCRDCGATAEAIDDHIVVCTSFDGDRRVNELTHPSSERWGHGFKFIPGDKEAASAGYRELIRFVSSALYTRFSYFGGQRVVWVQRPALSEEPLLIKRYPDGTDVDWDTYPRADFNGDTEDLIEVETGFICGKLMSRFWLEPEA